MNPYVAYSAVAISEAGVQRSEWLGSGRLLDQLRLAGARVEPDGDGREHDGEHAEHDERGQHNHATVHHRALADADQKGGYGE